MWSITYETVTPESAEHGEEHEFGSYGELQEYVHDYDNRCESCVEAKAEA
jgi:hypothetical protein